MLSVGVWWMSNPSGNDRFQPAIQGQLEDAVDQLESFAMCAA